jgi:hypothetical protein
MFKEVISLEKQYTINLHTDGLNDNDTSAWIALCGVDLQCGTSGCGNTPIEALKELLVNLGLD